MDWILPLFGSFIGATLPSSLAIWNSKRLRMEDAYAEFAGACQLLIRLSAEEDYRSSNDAWIRFGIARARVLFQERSDSALAQVNDLAADLETLHRVTVYLNPEEVSQQQKKDDAMKHGSRGEKRRKGLERLLSMVRDRS